MRRTFVASYVTDKDEKGLLDMFWKNSSRRKILKAINNKVKYSYLYFLN